MKRGFVQETSDLDWFIFGALLLAEKLLSVVVIPRDT